MPETLVRELTKQEQDLIDMLWDFLPKDPNNRTTRRTTGWGTKTKVGLVNSIAFALDKKRGNTDV